MADLELAAVRMPQLGESVTEGTVDRWLKEIGDHVSKDEPLLEIVTDKVNAEIPSPLTGRLASIEVAEGHTVAVGTPLAMIEVGPFLTPGAATLEGGFPADEADRPPLSPAVRRLAREHRVDLNRVVGTGAGGRITKEDVLALIATSSPEAGIAPTVLPVSPVRRSIAENMVRSVTEAPQAWTMQEVDATRLHEVRESRSSGFQRRYGVRLSYPALFARALVDALKDYPRLNSSWSEDGIVLNPRVNLGIAVAVEDDLLVPVVRGADALGLVDLARRIQDLTDRARRRALNPDDVRGGTITLNNTGATGSVLSQPILNPPQAAIVTMEAILLRPAVVDDQVVPRRMMNVCLTIDHRVLDGMVAGRFLSALRRRLEAWDYGDED